MRSSVWKFTRPMFAALALASFSTLSACSSDSGSDDVCAFSALEQANPVLQGTWCVTASELASNQPPEAGKCTAEYAELPGKGSDTKSWMVAVNGNQVTVTVGSDTLQGTASGLEMKLAGSLTINNPTPGGVIDISCAEVTATVPDSPGTSNPVSFLGEGTYQFTPNSGTVCTGVLDISAIQGPCT